LDVGQLAWAKAGDIVNNEAIVATTNLSILSNAEACAHAPARRRIAIMAAVPAQFVLARFVTRGMQTVKSTAIEAELLRESTGFDRSRKYREKPASEH
jgi:hypothetical protein